LKAAISGLKNMKYRQCIKNDYNWLLAYKNELLGKNVLELGCGNGLDTKLLFELCTHVSVIDINYEYLAQIKKNYPKVQTYHRDISNKLQFPDNQFQIIIASLCLHYFTKNQTIYILNEIKRILKPNSILIARVNSVNDSNFGALGYPEIEHGLYDVKGKPKRFFNADDIRDFLSSGWDIEHIKEKCIDRYSKPKMIWEFIGRNKYLLKTYE
jgi:ubiquinone/menaquinone biosynthesis C-methylase UbiE